MISARKIAKATGTASLLLATYLTARQLEFGSDFQLAQIAGAQGLQFAPADGKPADKGPRTSLDRQGLTRTFTDDFTNFSWYAEGLTGSKPGGGTWRTNFGYAGVQALNSRNLGSNGEMQVYIDLGFRGTSNKSLGINPFHIMNNTLEIVGDKTPDDVKPLIWNYQYTSGLITTQFSFSQTYGVFEIRGRMPKGRGLWPAFWLLPTDRTWPPEIDILEILGDDTTALHTNAHSKATGQHTDFPSVVHVADASATLHTYSVDWEKDEIIWFVDDAEVARAPTPADMHKPMYILAGLAIGGTWPGRPDQSTRFPAVFAINWIHAYRRQSQ